MKVTGVEILVAGAGWRNFNFVKVTTDEGLTDWAGMVGGNGDGDRNPLRAATRAAACDNVTRKAVNWV